MLLGACVVRSAIVNSRVWPTHLSVLSGQEIQMLLLKVPENPLPSSSAPQQCCKRVFGQSHEHVSWGHPVACRLALATVLTKVVVVTCMHVR